MEKLFIIIIMIAILNFALILIALVKNKPFENNVQFMTFKFHFKGGRPPSEEKGKSVSKN